MFVATKKIAFTLKQLIMEIVKDIKNALPQYLRKYQKTCLK